MRKNCEGSINGDASQNAMTGANGTPATSNAAITGMTPQEQNGESAPIRLARTIMDSGRPVKARAIRFSAPLAFA